MLNAKAIVFEFHVFEEMNTLCSQILFMFSENKNDSQFHPHMLILTREISSEVESFGFISEVI